MNLATAELCVREAAAGDLEDIRRIYNEGIEDRVATLDEEPKSSEEIRAWFADHGERYAILVAERAGAIAGWAALNCYTHRCAYNGVADLSIYVARAQRGTGIGSKLLGALETTARAHGFHKIVLFTFPFNAPGQRLYRKRGFREVGVFREQGRLDGRFVEVMAMEKILKPLILFVCRHNTGRSQMAEAYLRAFAGDTVEVASAGTIAADRPDPGVVAAMAEDGLDISSARPKLLDPELVARAERIITMGCDVEGVPRIDDDWGLPDPKGRPPERVREIRDIIRAKAEILAADVRAGGSAPARPSLPPNSFEVDLMDLQEATFDVRDAVKEKYGQAALRVSSGAEAACCDASPPQCCSGRNPITSNLYDELQKSELPETALLASLGCGNPTALAELRPGETVLDLGSGGGIDVLLSARRVSPGGKAYGLDMTDEMLALARENQQRAGVTNVEFLKGEIEAIPLPEGSVDVIISNCVINLSADKDRVLREAFRVLRPGGRFAVSDVVTKGDIDARIRANILAWVGCLAGALDEGDYRAKLAAAGFEDIGIEPTRIYRAADAESFLEEKGIDVGAFRDQIDGKFMSAFIRATKPSLCC